MARKRKEPPNFDNAARITEEAIPAAIQVKQKILDARDECIQSLGRLTHRRSRGRPIHNQLNDFQSHVVVLYQELRVKYKDTASIREDMDQVCLDGTKRLKFEKLYEHFCTLQQKIEDLKITKIERKTISDEKVF